MSLKKKLSLIWLNGKGRLGTLLVLICSSSLVLSLMMTVQRVSLQAEDWTRKQSGQYELVVGAEGSALQLTLNSLQFLDTPVGNVPFELYENLQEDDRVLRAIPIALGDTYKNHPIVGTSLDYFEPFREGLPERFSLSEGGMFQGAMEAVLGYEVSRMHGLMIGDELVSEHDAGDIHEEGYTVVGILAPSGTSTDRAVFVSYEDIWHIHEEGHSDEHTEEESEAEPTEEHEHEGHTDEQHTEHSSDDKELTSILVKPENIGLLPSLQEEYDRMETVQAVYPVTVFRDILQSVSISEGIVQLFSSIAVIFGFVLLLFVVLSGRQSRQREQDILYRLGYSDRVIRSLYIGESILLLLVSVGLSLLLSAGSGALIEWYSLQELGIILPESRLLSIDILPVFIGVIVVYVLPLFYKRGEG
ncbi:hypothetical protein Q75_00205 [Bacillus coahuilensis p1.1.43]|uniref:Putative hemin transport system permease protein HrtB n=1 Tax=Bacillus coahuilensis p1.1.43 TaxID=1150625 RepID=A0A147KCH3_9BACI|nr:ABC transporter permease [Bacillus coahuilensis]KUP09387.1 hypothetical protein Q75_00205 [Bacillus coahuilensis p1.1.43]